MGEIMKPTIRTALIVAVILSLSAVIFSLRQSLTKAENNYWALNDSVAVYKNKIGGQTSTVATLQLDNAIFRKAILLKNAKLKTLSAEFARLKSVVKTTTNIKLDTIRIAYTDSVPLNFTRSGILKEKWYSLNYTSDANGVLLTQLEIPDTTVIITGIKRSWFLGREKVVTDVTHANPFVKVNTIQSAEINVPTPWYKKWFVWLAAGFAGGMLLK